MKVLQIVKTNVGATWAFSQAKWLFDQGVDITTVIPVSVGGVADRLCQEFVGKSPDPRMAVKDDYQMLQS